VETSARLEATGYVLNGCKVWVSNREVWDVAIVVAASVPGSDARAIDAFLVPADATGLTRGRVIDSLGARGLGCRLTPARGSS
jgi:alkylation response protein AidB-like acyl-CoA dehydrogenase